MKERLISELTKLEKSIKGFDALEVVTLFMGSEYYSENIALGKLVERCLSWYANEMVGIDELAMIRVKKDIEKKFKC